MLSVLLEELSHVPRVQIVLINGLGTHRPNTEEELAEMLGPEIVANYRLVQHDAWDQSNVSLGRTSFGHDIPTSTPSTCARVSRSSQVSSSPTSLPDSPVAPRRCCPAWLTNVAPWRIMASI